MWVYTWSFLQGVLCTHEKNVCFAAVGWSVIYMSVRVIWSIVLVVSAVSLLILSGLFIHIEYGVLKSSIIFKNICLLVYFWLCWVFVAAHGLSIVVASMGCSSCNVWAFRYSSSSCCRAQAVRAWAPQLWLVGSGMQAQ